MQAKEMATPAAAGLASQSVRVTERRGLATAWEHHQQSKREGYRELLLRTRPPEPPHQPLNFYLGGSLLLQGHRRRISPCGRERAARRSTGGPQSSVIAKRLNRFYEARFGLQPGPVLVEEGSNENSVDEQGGLPVKAQVETWMPLSKPRQLIEMSARVLTEEPRDRSGESLPLQVAGVGGVVEAHLLPMLLFLLLWAHHRLILIQNHIKQEHAPTFQESNTWYCAELMRLVRHFRLGIDLLRKGNWGGAELAWFNRVSGFEVMLGSQLDGAGIMLNPPDPALVEKLKPIVSYALQEIEAALPVEMRPDLDSTSVKTKPMTKPQP